VVIAGLRLLCECLLEKLCYQWLYFMAVAFSQGQVWDDYFFPSSFKKEYALLVRLHLLWALNKFGISGALKMRIPVLGLGWQDCKGKDPCISSWATLIGPSLPWWSVRRLYLDNYSA
jgi:hypothetical protein